MTVYYVYRSPYIGPSGKCVKSFDAPTLLEWFQQAMENAARAADPEQWAEEYMGPHAPHGFARLFSRAVAAGCKAPQDTSQLHLLLKEHLPFDGEMLLNPSAIQVLTYDAEVQLAYYLFDDQFAQVHRKKAAYLLQDWPLPHETDGAELIYLSEEFLHPIKPAGRGRGQLFLLFMGFYDTRGLDHLTGACILDGVRLPDFDKWLAKSRDSVSWPVELRLLRAAAGLSRGSDDILGAALEKLRAIPLMCLDEEDSVEMTGRQLAKWLKDNETDVHVPQAGDQTIFRGEHLLLLSQYAGPGAAAGSRLYHQWVLFDDLWAGAHPLLADSMLIYATRWDVLSESYAQPDDEEPWTDHIDSEMPPEIAEEMAEALADEASRIRSEGAKDGGDDSDGDHMARMWQIGAFIYLDRLYGLVGDAQYARALRWAKVMEAIQQELGNWIIPRPHLAFMQAEALAILGDMPAALNKVAHYEWDENVSASLFWENMAVVYENGQDYERELACRNRAVALDPMSALRHVDVADSMIHHFGDVSGAKTALSVAQGLEMTPLAAFHQMPVMGTIALLEGRVAEALEYYDRALDRTYAIVRRTVPMLMARLRVIRGYRAVALARAGDLAQARLELAELREYFERARRGLIVRRIQAAIASEPEPLVPRR